MYLWASSNTTSLLKRRPCHVVSANICSARVLDRAHLAGVDGGGPRPAETAAVRPRPALLRPLDEYAAVAGGSF